MSIDVSSISLRYEDAAILNEVSFSVIPGEILALVGPNGAGKSSLLRIMAGNQQPSAGVIKYNGVPLEQLTIVERSILRSVMGQNNAIVYDYSVLDVIEMGWIQSDFSVTSEKELQSTLKNIATECKLESLLPRRFNTLSGGEQRRVHFARSILQLHNTYNKDSSKFLFLDEPTANMDIYWELRILENVKKLAGQGFGVFLIIHDLNLALKFADKIALLSQGKIKRITSPKNFFDEELFQATYGLEMSFNKDLMKIFYF